MNNNNLSREQIFAEIKRRADAINSDSSVKVISIVGGAGSGKTTLASEFVKFLGNACALSTDDYVIGDRAYRHQYLEGAGKSPLQKYNPKALNDNISAIKNLQATESLLVPTYDDSTGEAVDAKEYHKKITPVKYIIVEGDFDFVENPDLLIYFDVDDKTRLDNRIKRDIAKRGAVDDDSVKKSFESRQTSQHIPYTAPVRSKVEKLGESGMIIKATPTQNTSGDMYSYCIIDRINEKAPEIDER